MDAGERVIRPKGVLVSASVLAAVTLGLAIRMPRVLAQYQELLGKFDMPLPATTRVVMATPLIWWLFAGWAAGLAIWASRRNWLTADELRRMKMALRWAVVITALAVGIAVYSIVVVVFRLGAAV